MRTKTRAALVLRCMNPLWVETPLGQLAQLLVDSTGISVALIAAVMGRPRAVVHRWLLVVKTPGRSPRSIADNEAAINQVVHAIRQVYQRGEALSIENIKAHYDNRPIQHSATDVLPTSVS